MKRILAILWGDGDAGLVVPSAAHLAHRFGAEMTGLAIKPATSEFVPTGDFGLMLSQDYLDRLQREAGERVLRLRQGFDAAIAAAGIGALADKADAAEAHWVETEGPASAALGHLGRLHDLIVVRRPDTRRATESEILLEAALFETGRPVLAVPAERHLLKLDTILIAWNGSIETARVIALGMPLLRQAERVHVVSADGATVAGPTAAEIARYLGAHGITAQSRHIPGGDAEEAGAAYLREAEKIGADLVFKGAYTQSRLRQLIFGGATRYILSNATMPVLLAH